MRAWVLGEPGGGTGCQRHPVGACPGRQASVLGGGGRHRPRSPHAPAARGAAPRPPALLVPCMMPPLGLTAAAPASRPLPHLQQPGAQPLVHQHVVAQQLEAGGAGVVGARGALVLRCGGGEGQSGRGGAWAETEGGAWRLVRASGAASEGSAQGAAARQRRTTPASLDPAARQPTWYCSMGCTAMRLLATRAWMRDHSAPKSCPAPAIQAANAPSVHLLPVPPCAASLRGAAGGSRRLGRAYWRCRLPRSLVHQCSASHATATDSSSA